MLFFLYLKILNSQTSSNKKDNMPSNLHHHSDFKSRHHPNDIKSSKQNFRFPFFGNHKSTNNPHNKSGVQLSSFLSDIFSSTIKLISNLKQTNSMKLRYSLPPHATVYLEPNTSMSNADPDIEFDMIFGIPKSIFTKVTVIAGAIVVTLLGAFVLFLACRSARRPQNERFSDDPLLLETVDIDVMQLNLD